jgi:succinylglutamate desuccinylase
VIPPAGASEQTARADDAAKPGLTRILGRYGGEADGPLVCVVAGLHGNEPAGVKALQRIVTKLQERRPVFRGEFIAIAGNLPALREGVRFLDNDLNRGWSVRRVARTLDRPASVEDRERADLVEVLVPRLREANHQTFVVDLHSTSSPSAPFLTLADTLDNRAYARLLGMPLVLGLEEQIDDAMLEYLGGFGPIALGVEAGQHDDPTSVDVHEAAVWMVLVEAGCLARDTSLFDLVEARRRIARARASLPHIFEVVYRRCVEPGDGFRMDPGYHNFQRVEAGQRIAQTHEGPVLVPEDGWLFLPLYQELGDDAYFLVRPVRPIWLRISGVLRRLGTARVLPLLPGVHRARERPNTYLVDRRIARWLVVQFFHLLGYRRVRGTPNVVVFRKQGSKD